MSTFTCSICSLTQASAELDWHGPARVGGREVEALICDTCWQALDGGSPWRTCDTCHRATDAWAIGKDPTADAYERDFNTDLADDEVVVCETCAQESRQP